MIKTLYAEYNKEEDTYVLSSIQEEDNNRELLVSYLTAWGLTVYSDAETHEVKSVSIKKYSKARTNPPIIHYIRKVMEQGFLKDIPESKSTVTLKNLEFLHKSN